MLSCLGETEIDSLDNPTSDITLALSMLHRVTEEVQLTSWHFNTDENVTLTSDDSGEINLSDNVHQVDFIDANSPYIKKGNKIYDKEAGSYKINKKIKADLIKILPFEDIPIVFQHYIAIRAARKYQNNIISSSSINGFLQTDELEAKLKCLKEEQVIRKVKIRHKLISLFR